MSDDDPFECAEPNSLTGRLSVYQKLGYNWATTVLALLTLAMAPFP
jgi:hypothetical protein